MNLQLFDNPEFGKVRVIGDADNPLFCLPDVCHVLELDASQVMKRLDDGVVTIHPIFDNLGRTQMANFVNEDGLYDVILDSRKPNAKRFRKWITSEVIPSIRKTGLYVNPNAPITGDMVIALGMRMKELEAKNAALTAQIEADAPKVSYYDLILQCPDLVSTSQIAKDYGMSAKAFNTLLHRLGVQFNQGGVWLLYQKFARLGWTSSKTHVYADENGKTHSRSHTYWTQRGRLGLYELLKRNGYLPTIEQAA